MAFFLQNLLIAYRNNISLCFLFSFVPSVCYVIQECYIPGIKVSIFEKYNLPF
jgi:hypothetical protein